MGKHLAIFSAQTVKKILSGEKKIECRFSQKRIDPFGKIGVGDVVYIKPPGREIVGQFRVKKVLSFQGLDKEDWQYILKRVGEDELTKAHVRARFATLIFIDKIEEFITAPVKINKSDLRGWVVLD